MIAINGGNSTHPADLASVAHVLGLGLKATIGSSRGILEVALTLLCSTADVSLALIKGERRAG